MIVFICGSCRHYKIPDYAIAYSFKEKDMNYGCIYEDKLGFGVEFSDKEDYIWIYTDK